MAEQKSMWFADDGTVFETEQAAIAHDALQAKEKVITDFAFYHAAMLGRGTTFARQFAAVLRAYERCTLSGVVPEVPAEVIKRNQETIEQRKQKRLAKKTCKKGRS